MPRRDGFPTNREMQVDFTTEAHDVFMVAAERELEAKVPPAFEDKPLDHLTLQIQRRNLIEDGTLQSVRAEQLCIQPVSWFSVYGLEFNQNYKDAHPDILQYLEDTARRIGSLALTDSLRFRRDIGAGGTEADYTAFLVNGRTRHASTFRERPSKQSLAAAKFFVTEAAEYVQSDRFGQGFMQRLANFSFGYSDQFPVTDMHHSFSFRISCDLPLNGHEPKAFLQAYAAEMHRSQVVANKRLERFEQLQAPQIFIAREREGLEKFRAALDRVNQYL